MPCQWRDTNVAPTGDAVIPRSLAPYRIDSPPCGNTVMRMTRLPAWMRKPLRTDGDYAAVHDLLAAQHLHTVCRSAHCPNIRECWSRGTATFMILGDVCTRDCRFCAVDHGRTGRPDEGEPARVAEAAREMRLTHVVVTSVTRDDLPDGGAGVFAATIRAIRGALPDATVEVLTPDFRGDAAAIGTVLDARPDVFAHNLETVRRLQPAIRPQASYERSLAVLRVAAGSGSGAAVKSGLMLGLGETDEEIGEAMQDLRAAGCEILTLGQYLAPSKAHAPVARFIEPAGFDALAARARELGFKGVASAPLVRSSYRAGELLNAAR